MSQERAESVVFDLSPAALDRRFWRRVACDPDGCWNWTGYIGTHGYGRITIRYRDLLAHRVSYTLAYGPIPTGLWVLHRCDNRRCVRPDHLWLGTTLDNTNDRHAKGRSASGARCRQKRPTVGDRHWSKTHPELIRHGSNVHNAKFTEDDVRSIRRRFASGHVTAPMLAAQYGVTRQAIHAIIKRKLWQHVE